MAMLAPSPSESMKDPPPQYSNANSSEWQDPQTLSRSSSTHYMEQMEFSDTDRPPSYSAAVTMRGELSIKQELVTPFRKSMRRPWRRVDVEIDNTQLRIKTCVGGMFYKTQSHTLQFAEVGLASDYTKKEHNIRLRVEARQYLIHCGSCKNMLRWFLAFQMAIGLALPLELRTLPEDSKRQRNKLRDRERRERRERHEQRERLRDALGATVCPSQSPQRSEESGRPEAQNVSKSRSERRRQGDSKWKPRTRQSRFSEKDFPHLSCDAPWEGKDILYRGRWALVSNKGIVFLATH